MDLTKIPELELHMNVREKTHDRCSCFHVLPDPHFTLTVRSAIKWLILNHRLDAAVEFGAKVSKSKLMFTTSRYTNQLCPT